MSDGFVPDQILVLGSSLSANDDDYETRRVPGLPGGVLLQAVELSTLQSQVTIFLQQLNLIVQDAPEQVGGFQLAEFEVSAGIVAEGKGKVNLALIANAEAGGEVNATIRFVFRRAG
jgi:hypothetical protein